MKRLVAEAMRAGAIAMSTGLIYPPGVYTTTQELMELSKVVANYGGVYASHIRGEGNTLIKAIEEVIEIGEKTEVPVHISHHKAAGKPYWGRTSKTLQLIEKGRKRGINNHL